MPDQNLRLRDVLDLAAIAEKAWLPKMHALRASGVPLNLEAEKTLLEELRDKRSTLLNEIGTAIEARQAERTEFEARTDATDEDRSGFATGESGFRAAHEVRMADVETLDQRISEQELLERRRADAATASARDGITSVKEPMTYRQDNAHEISYFRDLAMTEPKLAQSLRGNPTETLERLDKHGREVGDWMARRIIERERRADEQIDRAEREFHASRGEDVRGFDASPFEKRVNPNRTPGQGGYFVPPTWLIEDYIPALRAGRVAANLVRQMVLPEGTNSINIPKVGTGTIVGYQGADGAAVPSQDITDTSVQANVKTIAGQEDVPIQLVEQSPGRIFDQVVTEDLFASYNLFLDQQVVKGNGTNSASLNGGQLLGIYPSGNWGANTVTWTTSTPLGNGFNMVMGAMASKTATSRYSLENFNFLFHPRRWFWFATSLDASDGKSGRPLVNPVATGYNISATGESNVPPQGLAGSSLFGPDVYIDANLPTNDTSGTPGAGTADVAIGAKWDDLWLFEGDLRTRVMSEVLSGTLEVRYQLWNYVAFLVRYGSSITIASGTGFSPPVSAIDASVTF